MSAKPVVETIYGKYHKYEIVKDEGVFTTHFYIRRDGKAFRGPYSSLSSAVEAAKEAG
jgi:hypothetical protein